jgi:hypothetical protein
MTQHAQNISRKWGNSGEEICRRWGAWKVIKANISLRDYYTNDDLEECVDRVFKALQDAGYLKEEKSWWVKHWESGEDLYG